MTVDSSGNHKWYYPFETEDSGFGRGVPSAADLDAAMAAEGQSFYNPSTPSPPSWPTAASGSAHEPVARPQRYDTSRAPNNSISALIDQNPRAREMLNRLVEEEEKIKEARSGNAMEVDEKGKGRADISTDAHHDGDTEMGEETPSTQEPGTGAFTGYRDSDISDVGMSDSAESHNDNTVSRNSPVMDQDPDLSADGQQPANLDWVDWDADVQDVNEQPQDLYGQHMAVDAKIPWIDNHPTVPEDFCPAAGEAPQQMAIDSAQQLPPAFQKVGIQDTDNQGGNQVMADPFHLAPPAPTTWMSNLAPSFDLTNQRYRSKPDVNDGAVDGENDAESGETVKMNQWTGPLVRQAPSEVVVPTAKSPMSSTASTSPVEEDASADEDYAGESGTSEHGGSLPLTPARGSEARLVSPMSTTPVSAAAPVSSPSLHATPTDVLPTPPRVLSIQSGAAHRTLAPVSISSRMEPRPARPRPIEPPIELNMARAEDAPKLDSRFIVSMESTRPQCKILPPPTWERPKRNLDAAPRAKEVEEDALAEEYEDNDGYRQKVAWAYRDAPPLDEDALLRLEQSMKDAADKASEEWSVHQVQIDEQTASAEAAKKAELARKFEAKKRAQAQAYLRRMEAKKGKAPNPLGKFP
ncbi:hypothetical protein F5Y14DRAFT_435526 [Nemania sp. NC0429]|nr:hypothetical protein F5Y14DRAFT_435526 [Nemania sp. NC0429]